MLVGVTPGLAAATDRDPWHRQKIGDVLAVIRSGRELRIDYFLIDR
jgi:hypothetical protein